MMQSDTTHKATSRPHWIPLLLLTLPLGGCGLFASLPEPTTTKERLAVIDTMPPPELERPVEIYWSAEQIPYIIAATDADAAFALGLVHAHLRLGQMELAKRAAAGRLTELGGRRLTKIDAAIRAVDYYQTAERLLENMSPEAQQWMHSYSAGVNHYKRHLAELPHDFTIGNMENEPWSPLDSIAVGRLASSDIGWMTQAALLRLRDSEDWERIFEAFTSHGEGLRPSFPIELSDAGADFEDIELFARVLSAFTRHGSNSMVISGERSASGAPILANEPHLGFLLPNLWLLAGLKSPSYQVVGMMAPGTPIFALGRNPHISWGGTNMRSYSSDIVEVTGEEMTEVEHRLERRFARSKVVSNRVNEVGPVISDLEMFEFPEGRDFALRWAGHLASDELSAYLGVMRAKGWREIKTALSGYGSPGQNMLFADKDGTIGQFSAVWLPSRPVEAPKDLWVDRESSDKWWQTMLTVDELPMVIDPPGGVVASANNKPAAEPPTRMAWSYPRDDRIGRIYEMMKQRDKWDVAGLVQVFSDTYSPAHHRLNGLLVERARGLELDEDAQAALAALVEWDGRFDAESKGAYVHIGVVESLSEDLYDDLGREEEFPMWWNSTYFPNQLAVDIEDGAGVDIDELLADALEDAEDLAEDEQVWGDVHKLKVGYIAVNLPVGGSKYLLYELPMDGGVETLHKSAHSLTAEEHFAYFGSQSRHYSDMADDDANYFVIYGGQDGWVNSENFADQVGIWAAGDTIQVPLRVETVRASFPHRTVLMPADEMAAAGDESGDGRGGGVE